MQHSTNIVVKHKHIEVKHVQFNMFDIFFGDSEYRKQEWVRVKYNKNTGLTILRTHNPNYLEREFGTFNKVEDHMKDIMEAIEKAKQQQRLTDKS